MSLCFRPVIETWGTHSDMFLSHEDLLALLDDLAARVDTDHDETEYGELTAVWFAKGAKVLDYIEKDKRFNAKSFMDSLTEIGVEVDRAALGCLLSNMRNLVPGWRNSIDPRDGSLRFYID